MSERKAPPAGPSDAVVEAELAPIADELFGLRPEDFSAARDAHIRSARASGKAALARELGKLRKPTQSAWLINLIWRDQREVMQQLFELAAELSHAQAEAAGAALRVLATQRRELEVGLIRRAAALAEQAGVRVSESVVREAQDTLSAALARPDIADEVRSGHLVKPATYAGFGVPPAAGAARVAPSAPREPIDLQAAQRAREAERERIASAQAAVEVETEATAAERRAEEERRAAQKRRVAAERRLEEARAGLVAAGVELADKTRTADAARQRRDDVRQRLQTLRAQLLRVESEMEGVEKAAAAAESARKEAEQLEAQAREAVDQSEAELTQA